MSDFVGEIGLTRQQDSPNDQMGVFHSGSATTKPYARAYYVLRRTSGTVKIRVYAELRINTLELNRSAVVTMRSLAGAFLQSFRADSLHLSMSVAASD
jgi:hypothetical protein